jgi:hypothetical protein
LFVGPGKCVREGEQVLGVEVGAHFAGGLGPGEQVGAGRAHRVARGVQLGGLVGERGHQGGAHAAEDAGAFDEQAQPCGERVRGAGLRLGLGLGLAEGCGACGEAVVVVADDGLDEGVAGGEVPVQGADSDVCAAGEVFERGLRAVFGEGEARFGEQAVVVAAGVGPHRSRHRGSLSALSNGACLHMVVKANRRDPPE